MQERNFSEYVEAMSVDELETVAGVHLPAAVLAGIVA
jgi:hypothetical protein